MILLLAAALSCLTPQGYTLTLRGEPHGQPGWGAQAASHRQGLIWQRLEDSPGGWRKLSLELSGSVLTWPRGQRLIAILADSSRVPADQLFALTPDLNPVDLGGEPVAIASQDLFLKPLGRGTAVMCFVRFPGLQRDPVAITVIGR